ncbi:MAG: hypothetical protein FJX72_10270 [Armatimonadetes bacterium]|nr:hypothetical protein [Armatimonadota bacterium]
MASTLFSDTERMDGRVIQCGESTFHYLDRGSHPRVAEVRSLLERMLAGYPPAHRNALVRRLRSDDDGQFYGAYFELVLYSMMVGSGLPVEAVEPEAPPSPGRRPDFRVVAADGARFYVEARVVTRQSRIAWLGCGDLPLPVCPEPPVRRRIQEKMEWYGVLDLPLVLAVSSLDMLVDRLSWEDILLGTYAIEARLRPDGRTERRVVRGPTDDCQDGVLAMESAPNVSAFLLLRGLIPINEWQAEYCLYHNPRARLPLRVALPVWNRAVLRRWGWQYREGAAVGRLAGCDTE